MPVPPTIGERQSRCRERCRRYRGTAERPGRLCPGHLRNGPPVTGDLLALLVADDLTGAADSAVAFARRGVLTRVVFDPPSATTGGGGIAGGTHTRPAGPGPPAQAAGPPGAASPPAPGVVQE